MIPTRATLSLVAAATLLLSMATVAGARVPVECEQYPGPDPQDPPSGSECRVPTALCTITVVSRPGDWPIVSADCLTCLYSYPQCGPPP